MANQKVIEKKQLVVQEIEDNIKDSKAIVFFDYSGLSVVELTDLRRKLKESDSLFKIYKNTLTKRALDKLEVDLNEHLVGPKAMAFSNNVVASIKIINEFSKKHKALKIEVGLIEGKIANFETLKEIATIPSRDGLLTQLAAGLMGVVRDLSICLDLYSKNLENQKEEI